MGEDISFDTFVSILEDIAKINRFDQVEGWWGGDLVGPSQPRGEEGRFITTAGGGGR